jgi:hypothetical protein
VKCHRNGFSDCWREQCAIWLIASGKCGENIIAQLAQEQLCRIYEQDEIREKARRESLTIETPEVHRVGLSYE